MAKQAELQLAKKKDTDFHFISALNQKCYLAASVIWANGFKDFMQDTRLTRLNSLGAGWGWGELPRKNDGDADRLAQG